MITAIITKLVTIRHTACVGRMYSSSSSYTLVCYNWNYMIKGCFELHVLHTHSKRWHNYAKCSIFKIFCSFLQNPYVLLWSVAWILTVGVYFLDHQVSCVLPTAFLIFFLSLQRICRYFKRNIICFLPIFHFTFTLEYVQWMLTIIRRVWN